MFIRGNGLAMARYQSKNHVRESVGGIWWGWRQFFSSRICYEEGVWFHTLLLSSSLAQLLLIVLTITLIYAALFEVFNLYTEADENGVKCVLGQCAQYFYDDSTQTANGTISSVLNKTDPIRDAVTAALVESFGNFPEVLDEASQEVFYNALNTLVYNATGLNLTNIDPDFLTDAISDPYGAIQEWFLSNVEMWEAVVAVCVGGFFCALSVFAIVAVYIPSFISNVLQFRAGMIAGLNDSEFELYRRNTDQATSVFGTAFWGQVFTAGFAFFVPGAFGFFLVWSKTRTFVTGFVAQLIGIAVTLGVKMLVLVLLRRFLMVVFYRKKIALSNIVFVLLECWNIALSTGFLVARAGLIFGVAIFYLGRIDTLFLAPGVGQFGKVSLDKAPICYRKDLLLHEAHRHPYIERLGALYLMKLRHGHAFGSRAGSCWRLLYVLALMPWMRKYRGHERTDELANLAPPLEQPIEFASKPHLIKGMGGVSSHELETELSIKDLSERRQMLREQSERLTAQIESMKKPAAKEESHELDA